MSSLRKRAKQVPGVYATYKGYLKTKSFVRRTLVGPERADLYDIETAQVIERVLKHDSNAVDIGAHKGKILESILKQAPNGRHHAVEALPHLAEKLTTTFPQVQVHNCAVGKEPGTANFNYIKNYMAYSGLKQREYPSDDVEVVNIEVEVNTLDNMIGPEEKITFIKADIEGGEYDAFCGGTETILRSKPVIVFEYGFESSSTYGYTPDNMYELLHDRFKLNVSTQQKWLTNQAALTKEQFLANESKDWYFIAWPDE